MVTVILADLSIILSIIMRFYYLIILTVPLAIIYLSGHMKEDTVDDKTVLSVAKSIQRSHARGRGALAAIESLEGDRGAELILNEISRRCRLGESLNPDSYSTKNYSLRELIEILLLGINTGSSMEKNLELLIKRLENDVSRKNRLNARIGGINSLTYAGMAFFLPLFGGISSSILSTSLSVISTTTEAMQMRFLLVVDLYSALILYITDLFRNPNNGIIRRLYTMLPISILSTLILFAGSNYVANLL